MAQHTWFLKSKDLYLKQNELFEKLDKFETNDIYLSDLELLQIETEIDEIDEQNDAEYHDLFRTNKRNKDNTYIDEVIFSRRECFEWINNPENLVEKFEYTIDALNEFWDKYPDGVIYFG
jgi:hypothetical protein